MFRSLLVLLLVGSGVFAEEPFAFERAPGRLPKEAIPHRYRVHLEPKAEQGEFSGTEVIEVEVQRPIRQIVLNSLGLQIRKATWRAEGAAGSPLKPEASDETQLLTLPLPEEQPAGRYELEISWEGKLSEQPQGFFLTRYATPDGEQTAVTTQMEAADARRVFPCWDEPAFRAVFELSAIVPEKQLAFSNMPIVSEEAKDAGRKEVQFAPTPPMASYLVAFSSGEFDTLEDEIAGVHLRIITTPGKREQGRYALEATKLILPFYNDYFGARYPLPKLDQFCYPGFAAGGMENWGAIFYNDSTLLLDPKTATQGNRERVFGVVAHEIAHQWFGDLVTMGWWDNLWLNEGFASWMATKASDHFNPAWHSGERAAMTKEWAMHRDARSTTHPIQQPVKTEAQASEAFDEITYEKGGSLLRMLEAWLGEDAFREGIRRYMADHALSNTTTADLWSALEAASGKPVREVAARWTEQPGFPVVHLASACIDGRQQVTLTQEHFTIHQKTPAPLWWEIPIGWSALGQSATAPIKLLGELPLTFAAGACGPAIRANVGGIGYFRTAYDPPTFAKLAEHVAELPETDRLTLLVDTWALVQADRAPAPQFLGLLEKVAASDRGPLVWQEIVSILRSIDSLLRGEPSQRGFRLWESALVRPELQRLAWEPAPEESPLAKSLRATVIDSLAAWGDAETLAEGARRFAAFEKDPASLPADLRPAILMLIGRQADQATYAHLHELALHENATEKKNELYRALSANHQPALAAQTLEISLRDELPPPSAVRLVSQVAENGELPELAWIFAREHEKALLSRLASIRAQSYLPNLARNFNDASWADELETFAREKLPPASAPSVAQATDEIRFKSEFKAKFIPELARWLEAEVKK